MSQIITMAKKLQDAEQVIARLQAAQAAAQSAAESANGALDVSRTDTLSTGPSPRSCADLQAEQQQSETFKSTHTNSDSYLTQVTLPESVSSGSLISDLSLDENGKLCYYGPTSAVHDPPTIESISTTDQQYDSPSAKSNVRSMLTSNAMESRAWEDFAVGNAAFRSEIPRPTLSHLLNLHWSWVAPMFMWVYRPAFMRTYPKA
jgi:hypothetical protein